MLPYPQRYGIFPKGSVHAYRPPCAPQVAPAPKVPVALLHKGPPRLLQDVDDVLSALCWDLSWPIVLTWTQSHMKTEHLKANIASALHVLSRLKFYLPFIGQQADAIEKPTFSSQGAECSMQLTHSIQKVP